MSLREFARPLVRPWFRVVALGRRWKAFGRWPSDQPLRIVTGSDSSHFRSMLALLSSIERHEPDATIVVWDLGLSASERAEIGEAFESIRLRRFDFDAHPPHFDISTNSGQYAWKPVIIDSEVRDATGFVIWLDAGCRVMSRLRWFRRYISALGVYSPHSAGSLREWTHPGTLAELDVAEELLDRRMFSGGVVGVDPTSTEAAALIRRWAESAHSLACIAPPGSSRSNHRQDQSIMSCLMHQGGFGADSICRELYDNGLGILVHQDID